MKHGNQGIMELIPNEQTPMAPAQSANPDFVNLLQTMAGGGQPDFNKLYQAQQQAYSMPERPKEEFNLKNVLSYLSDSVANAAKANRENPRGGVLGALAAGSGGAYEQREEKHRAKHGKQKDIMSDLTKMATDQRKYQYDMSKLARDMQSKDLLDELRRAQTEKAKRGPAEKAAKAPKTYTVNASIMKQIDGMIKEREVKDEVAFSDDYRKQLKKNIVDNYKTTGDLFNAFADAEPMEEELEVVNKPGSGVFGYFADKERKPKAVDSTPETQHNRTVVQEMKAKGYTADRIKQALMKLNLTKEQAEALLK